MSEAATINKNKTGNTSPLPSLHSSDERGEGESQTALIDEGAIRGARQSLAAATKNLGKTAKDVFDKAFELQQLSMFGEVEFEEGLLFDAETMRKKYTGGQAEKMEWRRDLCLYLLSRETPMEDIAKLLKMNLRTISALAAKHGRTLGAFTEDFANRLIASAASDIALADTKRDSASYKDLHVGAGIKMTHALGVKLMADTGGQPAVELEAADDKLAGLREKIKKLKPVLENET
jgi:hypothetical protein